MEFANHMRGVCRSRYLPVTKSLIKSEARLWWMHLHPRAARSLTPFSASDGWVQRFKWRHGFCTGKTQVGKKIKESEKADIFNMMITYSLEIEQAVHKYGAECVLNMDETPCELVEVPHKSWGMKQENDREVVICSW